MLRIQGFQGYLAHEKEPPPLELPKGPRHSATVGSSRGTVSHGRGTPVAVRVEGLGLMVES